MEFSKSLLKDAIDRSQRMPPAQQPQPKPEKLNSSFMIWCLRHSPKIWTVGGETSRYWEKSGSICFPSIFYLKKPIETQVFFSAKPVARTFQRSASPKPSPDGASISHFYPIAHLMVVAIFVTRGIPGFHNSEDVSKCSKAAMQSKRF